MSDTTYGPDRNALIRELSRHRLQVMWSLRRQAAQVFEPLGVNPVRVLILELVSSGVTQSTDLTRSLGIAAPATSALLRELMERGWLERKMNGQDKREADFILTVEGKTFCDRLNEEWFKAHSLRFGALSDKQLENMVTLTEKLHEGVS